MGDDNAVGVSADESEWLEMGHWLPLFTRRAGNPARQPAPFPSRLQEIPQTAHPLVRRVN